MSQLKNGFVISTEVNTTASYNVSQYAGIKITQNPKSGSVSIKKGQLVYVPDADFVGNDVIRFTYVDARKQTESVIVVNVTENYFKPRARLLLQLGDQLIRNENIAIVELAKNAYDADASYCKIELRQVGHPKTGEIIIEDDGWGMSIDTIKNSWLEPGSDEKEKQVKASQVTPKFKRLPIGEKGIGRFGVHKLGKKIELISKSQGSKEVVVRIDWQQFGTNKYLQNAPIKIEERAPKIFTGNKTGTRIVITDFHKEWTRGMVRDMFRSINALSTPTTFSISDKGEFEEDKKGSFTAEFSIDTVEWIKDIPSWDRIRDYALFFFDIEITGDKISRFRYKFSPWQGMQGVQGRLVTEGDKIVSDLIELIAPDPDSKKKVQHVDLNDFKIGPVKFKGSIFIRDKAILKIALNQSTSVSNYLDLNGGMRVYRNGMRVYDYGEPGNDWLELDYRRFNDPGLKISNNMIIGSVNLDRSKSSDLVEKTNREGFIDNGAYIAFRKAILHALRIVELLRRQDKNKIDATVKSSFQRIEPVTKTISDLKDVISKKVKDADLKKELTVIVARVEKNYKFMNDTLIKTASVGVGWSIYIHEIDKIILEIEKVIKQPNSQDRLSKLISHLAKIIDNYAEILRKSSRKDESPYQIIDQALFNIEFRLKAHKIELVSAYKEIKDFPKIKVSRSLIIGTLMNIIDNSIYWLERARIKNKKIFVGLSKEENGYISVVIADNGPGFALPTTEIVEPLVSAKPDGMGLGLHLAREILGAHGGKLSFNELGNFHLPKEFQKGAVVVLGFLKK